MCCKQTFTMCQQRALTGAASELSTKYMFPTQLHNLFFPFVGGGGTAAGSLPTASVAFVCRFFKGGFQKSKSQKQNVYSSHAQPS